MRSLWVDILCWESAFKVLALNRRQQIARIYFLNRAKAFPCWAVGLLQKLTGKPVGHADDIIQGDDRIDGVTLFELIYLKMADWCDQCLVHLEPVAGFSGNEKWKIHIQEALCNYMYKPAEMVYFARFRDPEAEPLFLLKSEFTRSFLRGQLESKAEFYNAWFSLSLGVEDRRRYHWDAVYNKIYVSNPFALWLKLFLKWKAVLATILFVRSMPKLRPADAQRETTQANIGAELLQARFRPEAINDLYWLKDSKIDPATVCTIEFEDYGDAESKNALAKAGVRRCRSIRGPLKLFSFLSGAGFAPGMSVPVPPAGRWLKLLPGILAQLGKVFASPERAWIEHQRFEYDVWVNYWQSVYDQLGIKVLWSMHDVEPEKLIKAKALENLGAVFAGSHWSFFPMPCLANDRKCYDVFFPWSRYHTEHVFVRDAWAGVFSAGYPLDFYFNAYRSESDELRGKYKGKFILTYMDNAVSYDYSTTPKMRWALHAMLMELLEQYPQLVVFLKPKRNNALDEILAELPEMEKFLKSGRMAAFLADGPRSKVAPVKVGLASDLVVAMGLGTAALECYFAGGLCLFAEQTRFKDNPFGDAVAGKLAFPDTTALKRAIANQIEGKGITRDDGRKEIQGLEPFQDGKAYLRTGAVLAAIQKEFMNGADKAQAIDKAAAGYEPMNTARYAKV